MQYDERERERETENEREIELEGGREKERAGDYTLLLVEYRMMWLALILNDCVIIFLDMYRLERGDSTAQSSGSMLQPWLPGTSL